MPPRHESIEVHSAVRLSGYFWAEDAIFEAPITGHAKLVYLYLKRCADGEGESYPLVETIAKACGWSRSTVTRVLAELVDGGLVEFIQRRAERRPNLYTVKSVVADPPQVPQTLASSPTDLSPQVSQTHRRNTHGRRNTQEGTSMSGKPDVVSNGNGNGHHLPEHDLLAFLNRKAGKHFQPLDANLKLIRARLKDATVDQIRAVIGVRCRKWGPDPKMQEYLRPATLFNATNFAQYLGELPATAFMTDVEAEAYDARMS